MCKTYFSSKVREAEKRLLALDYNPRAIEDLKKGIVLKSEGDTVRLSYLTIEERIAVKEFECKYSAFVYATIFVPTKKGDLLHMLYVSDNKSEWVDEMADVRGKTLFSFVCNLTNPKESTINAIGISCRNGGLARVR